MPLGVTLTPEGVNVAVVSRHATRIFFCVFEDDVEVARLALPERLGDVHYGAIHGIREGTRYGFRAEGPWQPEAGHRFDVSKLLLDPYALEIDGAFHHQAELTTRGVDTAALVPKAIVRAIAADAEPLPPKRPDFIYEVPVRAFTKLHPGVPTEKRGTVAALAEPAVLDHLKRLGVDTVELMPVAAWVDERHLAPLKLSNAWGYNPVGFLVPDPRLAPGGLAEIRQTVEALHEAGLRVILDVVFNHTGESDEHGATLSLRGLDNALYYRHADGRLVNDTGCGNTLALDEAPVVQLAMDAMRSWVTRTGIDGFRFDLAPVMGRRATGFDANAPLLAAIEQDPLLSRLIMIAEPWDIGPGGYRLGQFPARWQEWNDRYRDDVRRFWNGDAHASGAFATRIAGSSDIFAPHRRPSASINFVAAHDGFTLRDSVTFAAKDNFANGEQNRDGNSHEPTWPGGDARALLATLFLSRGTPMLTAGDEFGRTQKGNNNAYAQENAITWLDWSAADTGLLDYTSDLVKLRRSLGPFLADRFLDGAPRQGSLPDAEWIGADGLAMDWHDPQAAVLGLVLGEGRKRLAILFNRGPGMEKARLPHRDGYRWSRIFSTATGEEVPAASITVFREEKISGAGVTDVQLRELAGAAGIEREWWEVDGTYHSVGPDTLRALLKALQLPHGTGEDLRHFFETLKQPGPIIGDTSYPVTLAKPSAYRRRFFITGNGETRLLEVSPASPAELHLPPGAYDAWSDGHEDERRKLIVSPGQCYLPEELRNGGRVFGLASHLYALRHHGGSGIGDFETLKRFASLTAGTGGRYAGINPLHHLFPTDRSRASPYQPSDRNFVDPIYIDIGQLFARFPMPKTARLAEQLRAAFESLEALAHVDYAAVWTAKQKLLESAFTEFGGDAAFDSFVKSGGGRLIDHGVFEARRARESVTPSRLAYRAFLQWIADMQLGEAARHGNLYCDLALGCAFDGGEISSEPDLFAGGVSIGAPPDPFSRAGQVWNLPPFSPLALARDNLEPMRRILSANMRHAAALRIDHVLGFARQFWVPKGAEGRNGAYVRFPLDGLIAVTALESRRNRCLVVGEDLGTVPDGLRDALSAADILSYRVLWFEREGAGFRKPQDYPAKALTCLASHDLPTFFGWRAGRDIDISLMLKQIDPAQAAALKAGRQDEVQLLEAAAHVTDEDGNKASAAVHGMVASTPSKIMLIQADDLAGERDPLNVPGTDREWPNWRRRVSVNVDQLADSRLAQSIIARVKEERPA